MLHVIDDGVQAIAGPCPQSYDASLTVFLAYGYVGTSTDQIAAAASVSKQSIHTYFVDKNRLFTALITDVCDHIHNPFDELDREMRSAPDAETAAAILAGQFTRSIMNPRVQEIRRLVLAEAARFPELGRLYWQRGSSGCLTPSQTVWKYLPDGGC